MKSNYKKLGPYIREVDLRNIDDKKDNLLGVSTQKIFIQSIANTIGTDFKKYKVVKRKQFTYVPDTSRRGDKIGIAMLEDYKEAIVSQAYTVFEIIDHNKLDPEYLMMWFRRSEFDRYARYKSHGSVREIFDWQEMCNVELPIPSIEKQKEIVREYNTIVERIKLNEQLCQKLEETAQALYKHWFVDFEFPMSKEYAESIGKPELEGMPYKSSGGEMEYSELDNKELPIGWKIGCWGDISSVFSGYPFKGEKYDSISGISVIRGENVTEQRLRWDNHKKWNNELPDRAKNCFLQANDIVIGMDGSKVGKNWALISPYNLPVLLAQRVACIRANEKYWQNFLYFSMFVENFQHYVQQVYTGTSIPHISSEQIMNFPVVVPENHVIEMFDIKITKCIKVYFLNLQEIEKLVSLKYLILSNLSKY